MGVSLPGVFLQVNVLANGFFKAGGAIGLPILEASSREGCSRKVRTERARATQIRTGQVCPPEVCPLQVRQR